jgi:hypothetical protein
LNAPPNSAVVLLLMPLKSNNYPNSFEGFGITQELPANGIYQWTIPSISEPCIPDGSPYCGNFFKDNGPSFKIIARLYSPASAWVLGMIIPDAAHTPHYLAALQSNPVTVLPKK